MLKAVTRQAAAVDSKIRSINADPNTHHPISTANFFDHHAQPDDIAVMVTEQDFLDANRELIPSVSAGELAHYEQVRSAFEGVRDKEKRQRETTPLSPTLGAGAAGTNPSFKGKGKGRAVKGKGKAVATASDYDEDDDDDGDAEGLASYGVNGRSKDKGKAVANRFQEATASDDEGLY
jgi:peroxin-6